MNYNLYDDITLEAITKHLIVWICYYNTQRLHSALENKTPEAWRKFFGDFFAPAGLPPLKNRQKIRIDNQRKNM